jgi:hypothetical protein
MPAEIKHTPGPWHWNGVATIWNTTGQVEEVDREVIVAQVVCDYGSGAHVEPIPVREANARLIAAAPELLAEHAEAIGELEAYVEQLTFDGAECPAALAALIDRMEATQAKVAGA